MKSFGQRAIATSGPGGPGSLSVRSNTPATIIAMPFAMNDKPTSSVSVA